MTAALVRSFASTSAAARRRHRHAARIEAAMQPASRGSGQPDGEPTAAANAGSALQQVATSRDASHRDERVVRLSPSFGAGDAPLPAQPARLRCDAPGAPAGRLQSRRGPRATHGRAVPGPASDPPSLDGRCSAHKSAELQTGTKINRSAFLAGGSNAVSTLFYFVLLFVRISRPARADLGSRVGARGSILGGGGGPHVVVYLTQAWYAAAPRMSSFFRTIFQRFQRYSAALGGAR